MTKLMCEASGQCRIYDALFDRILDCLVAAGVAYAQSLADVKDMHRHFNFADDIQLTCVSIDIDLS